MFLHRIKLFFVFLLIFANSLNAQIQNIFTKYDSLRGDIKYRKNIDVIHYKFGIIIDTSKKEINCETVLTAKANERVDSFILDVNKSFEIISLNDGKIELRYRRERDLLTVFPQHPILRDSIFTLSAYIVGIPVEASNPPWNGVFTYKKDKNNNYWLATSCQHEGLCSFLLCKDHYSDEPDSVSIEIYTKQNLGMAISNGHLASKQNEIKQDFFYYKWQVKSKINLYNVSLNIGNYILLQDTMHTVDNHILPLSYYVLEQNKEQATSHFNQVKPMLHFYEKTYGEYPFLNDGYKLVEAPFWGMEHQSNVAYGNHYKNNNFGFDFILIHESAHEWWGNSVTCADNADLWIHEAMTTYTEALYVEHISNKKRMTEYLQTQRLRIENNFPIRGVENVAFKSYPNSDMYFKGTWILHTLRTIVANDNKWFSALKNTYQKLAKKEINKNSFIQTLQFELGLDLKEFFDIFLEKTEIPTIYRNKNTLVINNCPKILQDYLSQYFSKNKKQFNQHVKENILCNLTIK